VIDLELLTLLPFLLFSRSGFRWVLITTVGHGSFPYVAMGKIFTCNKHNIILSIVPNKSGHTSNAVMKFCRIVTRSCEQFGHTSKHPLCDGYIATIIEDHKKLNHFHKAVYSSYKSPCFGYFSTKTFTAGIPAEAFILIILLYSVNKSY